MEGPVLPGQDSRIRAAPVLRPAALHGGDQLHLLSHAECEDGRRLGWGDSSRIHVRPQGAATHHPHRPAPGRGRPAALLPRNGTQAGPQARADPVPAAAQFQKGSGPPERPAHAVPGGSAVCWEFRHESWFTDDVYEALRVGNAALCVADTEAGHTPLVATADFGYMRLRDEGYEKKDLEQWAKTVKDLGKGWGEAFIFFKHEESGIGPKLAQQFVSLLAP